MHRSPEMYYAAFPQMTSDCDKDYLCWDCREVFMRTDFSAMNFGECAGCGAATIRSTTHNDREIHICTDCSQDVCICEDCGDLAIHAEYADLCNTCAENYEFCYNCGHRGLRSENILEIWEMANTGRTCKFCRGNHASDNYIQCACGKHDHKALVRRVTPYFRSLRDHARDQIVSAERLAELIPAELQNACSACIAEQVGWCCIGKHMVVNMPLYKLRNGRDFCCHECYAQQEVPPLMYYSTKPAYTFYGKNELKYGIELEMDFPRDDYANALKIMRSHFPVEQVFYKADGSLGNGFEAVTMPMDYDYLMSLPWNEIIAKIKAICPSLNTGTSAGNHIHMSKAAFTSLQLYKFLEFFNKYTEFVEHISGRMAGNYCNKFSPIYREGHCRVKYYAKTKNGTTKFTMVNLSHPNTVEVRLFKGIQTGIELLRYIQFLDALFNLCRRVSLREDLSPQMLKEYVKQHQGVYPVLHSFLSSNP
jgi:hypothetical protein